MSEFQIKDTLFRARKMPAREQLHVFRRLSPLIGAVGGEAIAMFAAGMKAIDIAPALINNMKPISDVLGSMPDDAVDYVMNACLVRADILDTADQKYHPIYVAGGGRLSPMYAGLINLGLELRIVGEVIKENFDGFFEALSAGNGSSNSADSATRETTSMQ